MADVFFRERVQASPDLRGNRGFNNIPEIALHIKNEFVALPKMTHHLRVLELGVLRDNLDLGVPEFPSWEEVGEMVSYSKRTSRGFGVLQDHPLQLPLAGVGVHVGRDCGLGRGSEAAVYNSKRLDSSQSPVVRSFGIESDENRIQKAARLVVSW